MVKSKKYTVIDRANRDKILNSRLQDNLDAYNAMSETGYNISMTTGLARYSSENPISLDELVEKADSLMYEKKRGKSD